MNYSKYFKRGSLLLLIGCLSLTTIACGKKGGSNDKPGQTDKITINTPEGKEAVLTSQNYKNYLNLSVYCTEGGEPISLEKPIALAPDYEQVFAYPTITGFLSTQPASSAFTFKDAKMKVEITGTYRACSASNTEDTKKENFKITLETPIDASGEALINSNFHLPEGYTTITSYITYEYKIVDVSGTILK